ncbi:MAG: AMP-binding enzyme, partial [bacterium]
VLNVSGHRLGTAEIESALVAHPAVAEAAVVGRPHDLKGQAVACFVTLKGGFNASPELENELRNHVGKIIGAIAKPDDVYFTPALPKTRSGIARTMEEAREVATEIGTFPLIVRPAFTLGGQGGGIAYNKDEFEEIVHRGLDLSPVSE